MKKSAVILTLVLLLAGLPATPALAQQAPTGQCNGDGAMQGEFSLSPTSGPAGSVTLLAGSTQLYPGATQESTTVNAWWMEPGNEQHLGAFPLSIDPDTLLATFGGGITVPADAAPGARPVAFMLPADTDPACLSFTVSTAGETPGGNDTPAPTVTRLPETGAAALASVAAGLATASLSLAAASLRKRSR